MSSRDGAAWGNGGCTREASAHDAFAVGVLVQQALAAAPSAEVDASELDHDALSLGANLLGGPGVDVVVAEVDGFVAGFARVARRDFLRSQHIADVQLLIHPAARRKGAGRALLEHVWGAFAVSGVYDKLAARLAEDDAASRAVFRQAGWVLERTERGALARLARGARLRGPRPQDLSYVDVLVVARYAPPPLGRGGGPRAVERVDGGGGL